MKLPRKLKKKLIQKWGKEVVRKILAGELIYKAKITTKITETGFQNDYGPKAIFKEIRF
jgi:hypothetical protein